MRLPSTHDEAVHVAHQVASVWRPGVIERDRSGAATVPAAAIGALDASGLLGVTIPAAHGGPDLGPVTLTEVVRILASVDPALAQVSQGHFLLVDVLAVHGSETARKRLFDEVRAGRRLATAFAERGGTHAQDLTTRLTGDTVSGRKYYTTGALTAAWIAVSALGADGRLRLAFVPRDGAGVTVHTDWDVMGQRATISGTAEFDAVPADPDLVVDYAGAYTVPQQLGARAQLVHAAIEVGIAAGALHDTRVYLRERARPSTEAVRAGASAAPGDPHVLHRYGRLATRVRAAQALLLDAAQTLARIGLVPAGEAAAAHGSLAVAAAKAFGSEVAVEAGTELFALCGTSATDERWDLHRHWRNARTHSVHDPVDWKYHHLGAYELADILPPNHGQL